MSVDLITAIEEFDGRDRSRIERILKEHRDEIDPAQLNYVYGLLTAELRRQRAAAVVVRKLAERGFEPLDLSLAFLALKEDLHWSTRFNLMQCVRYAPSAAQPYLDQIRAVLDDERTALRVVALDALAHLACLDPALLPEVKARLMRGAEDEMPSIRARTKALIKILQKAGHWPKPKKPGRD